MSGSANFPRTRSMEEVVASYTVPESSTALPALFLPQQNSFTEDMSDAEIKSPGRGVPSSSHQRLPSPVSSFQSPPPYSAPKSVPTNAASTSPAGSPAGSPRVKKPEENPANHQPRVMNVVPDITAMQAFSPYCTNLVRTSRYTALNFLPLNLYEQLSMLANFYFLCIGILQAIPEISTTNGLPNMYIPLTFILVVSGLRAAVEDYNRHQVDKKEGSRMFLTFRGSQKGFVALQSADLVVGEIVKVLNNQPFPADLVFLFSANARGHCFVETSSLDGETDLKPKVAVPAFHAALDSEEALGHIKAELFWEQPNKKLDSFKGTIQPDSGSDKFQLQAENLLLRGTVLKNTDFIYGIIVYTGEDTKIRCNVRQETRRIAKSSIFKLVDRCIIGMLVLQCCMCLLAAFLAGAWYSNNSGVFYLSLSDGAAFEGFLRFFTWFIIMSQFVPISLVVSSEIVKTFQAYFINLDLAIYDVATDTPTLVRSSTLNEDLGQVEFIFSDKTGTLTQNRMEFRVAFVGNTQFGSSETEISKRVKARTAFIEQQKHKAAGTNTLADKGRRTKYTHLVKELMAKVASSADESVQFDARDEYLDALWLAKYSPAIAKRLSTSLSRKDLRSSRNLQDSDEKHTRSGAATDTSPPAPDMLRKYLTHMAISNTITPIWDEKTERNVFQASSPDELALAKFGQFMGFELIARNPTRMHIHKFGRASDEEEVYRHLATLGFNSKRKRVTVIYERDGVVHCMMKGADSNMFPHIVDANETDGPLPPALVEMALNGLRTLICAYAEHPVAWWDKWKEKYEYISALPEIGDEEKHQKGACTDECRICAGMLEIETAAQFRLLGATAIEDRLQDLVPECIEDFLGAGVKVWMLTGDKRETAKNIGLACNLIDPDMEDAEQWENNRLIEVTGQWAETIHNRTELKILFDSFDTNHDGHIDREELQYYAQALQIPSSMDLIMSLFNEADKDQNGKIDFEEFVELMRNSNISMQEAVISDIKVGMATIKKFDTAVDPVSMVVEGSAFAVLYPHVAEDKTLKKKSKKRKAMEKQQAGQKQVEAPEPDHDDPMAEVRDQFYELAMKCKSCICCRLTPFQKAKIVQEIRHRKGVVTLAIGDGANDEAMILEADIGCGIAGLEGTAASRASDYAIGQFRFLHTLLFVHGHWSYRRISKLVPIIFYKAIVPVLVMFWFGFFSGMSGQQYYNDWIYLWYNVLFTAAPVMVLAILDRAISRDAAENEPAAYGSILKGGYFNQKIFYQWLARAFLDSIIIFFFVYGAYGSTNIARPDGTTHDLWFDSTISYTVVVMLCNLRICFEYVSYTWIHFFFLGLTLFGYYLIIYILTLSKSYYPDMFGVVPRIYGTASAWLTIILTVSVSLVLNLMIDAFMREFYPTLAQVLQERERMTPQELSELPPLIVAPHVHRHKHSRQPKEVIVEMHQSGDMNDPRQAVGFQRKEVVMANLLRKHNARGSIFDQNAATSQFLNLDNGKMTPRSLSKSSVSKGKPSRSSNNASHTK